MIPVFHSVIFPDICCLQQALDKEMAFYVSQRFAHATQKTYNTHCQAYLKFCKAMGYCAIPATTTTLCRYAVLLSRTLKYNSIKQYLNIIRILHLEWGLPNPLETNYRLSGVLQGIKRALGDRVSRKIPLTPAHLLLILKKLDLECPTQCNIWAFALVMFFGMLRRANVLSSNQISFDPSKHLRRRDLLFFPWGIKLVIRWSKTIQFKQRTLELPMIRIPNHPLCPVQAVTLAFKQTSGASPDGPAFMTRENKPLKATTFIATIQKALSAHGVDTTSVSGHSFRRGGASWAFQAGLSIDSIRQIGDWKSNCYTKYIFDSEQSLISAMRTVVSNLPTPT